VEYGSSAFIDQTMLCEAARLLQNAPLRPGETNVGRLVHLTTLFDSLALYDTLFVLRCELHQDTHALSLRQFLLETGVVQEFHEPLLFETVSGEVRDFLISFRSNIFGRGVSKKYGGEIRSGVAASLVDAKAAEPGRARLSLIKDLDSRVSELDSHIATVGPHITRLLWDDWEDRCRYQWFRDKAEKFPGNPLAGLGSDLMEELVSWGTDTGDWVSPLRTLIYWRLTDHLAVPLIPSWRRLPQYYSISNHVTRSTQGRVYKVVAKAFGAIVEEVQRDEAGVHVSLPPVAALFLDELRSARDLRLAVDKIRDKFGPLRRSLSSLQEEMGAKGSIGDRLKAKRILQKVMSEIEIRYRIENSATIDQLIAYAPEVIKPLTKPLSPGSYSAALVRQPLDWVRKWWLRRPFRIVFNLRKTLLGIPDYDHLLEQAIGIELNNAELADFQAHYDKYLNLYSE
jgi:hypothetical protein